MCVYIIHIIYSHLYLYLYRWIHLHDLCTYSYIYTYISILVFRYIYIYIYSIYREKERERERQRERERGRESERERERKIEREHNRCASTYLYNRHIVQGSTIRGPMSFPRLANTSKLGLGVNGSYWSASETKLLLALVPAGLSCTCQQNKQTLHRFSHLVLLLDTQLAESRGKHLTRSSLHPGSYKLLLQDLLNRP